MLYLAGILTDKYQTPQPNSNLVSKFETVLHAKEKELVALVDSVAGLIVDNEIVFDNSDTTLLSSEQMNEIKDKGFTILVFKNDTLKFWTDNYLNINPLYSSFDFSAMGFELSNYFLEVREKSMYDYNIVGLFRIKSNYSIENNYLKSEFNKDFDVSEAVDVSFMFTSESMVVKSFDNETLLFLTYGDESHDNPGTSWLLSIFYILSFLFLIQHANYLINQFYKKKRKFIYIPLMLLLVVAVRALLIIFKFPVNVFSQDFFDSQYFATYGINSSLGDLILNLMVYFTLAFHIAKMILSPKFIESLYKKNILKTVISIILLIGGFIAFIINTDLITNIVINSQIPLNLYNFLGLNIFSFFAFFSIIAIIILSVFVIFQIFEFATSLLKQNLIILATVFSYIAATGIVYFIYKQIDFISIILILITVIVVLFYKIRSKKIKLYHFSFLGFVSSILVAYVIFVSLDSQKTEKYKLKAFEMVNQRDDIGELLLEEIADKLHDDQTLIDYANNPDMPDLNSKVIDYLRRRYFKSYWNKYDISVNLCSKNDSIFMKDNAPFNCNVHFANILKNSSTKLNIRNTYFINSSEYRNSYLIFSNYPVDDDSATFYFTLSPKLYPSNIGYPELLLNNSEVDLKKPDYSFANYRNNKLDQKSGSYNYPLNGENFYASSQEIRIIDDEELRHLVYTVSDGDYVVLSFERLTFWNAVVIFSYIFLAFVVIIAFYALFSNISISFKPRSWNFRTKLIFSMLGVLSLTFTVIGVVTIVLNINQYNKNHEEEVIEKLREINIGLSEKYNHLDSITVTWQENELNYLDITLRKLSEMIGSDINLYDKNGQILATSRPEIYSMQLSGKQINPIAFHEIINNDVALFVHKENISSMEFTSAYSQLLNKENKLLAIINMPYFTKPDAFQQELTNLIVTIINIFVVLFVISMILSVLISEQIISPLIILQSKFKKLELGKKYEKIEYKRKDEIGELVSEYNKMVEKLDESIALLSKSERESAWRDMAKQIAHEIKNPLTPMKLSIQLLLRSWENQDEDFDYRLRDMSNTLIQQIETLKRIAEEFSDFAKMPKPQEQVINIGDKIEQMSKFYENTENVDIVANLNNFKSIFIIADDKQISRAFINLIKNAIQAIPEGVRGKINLDLDVYADKVRIKFTDNGSGIPEEIKDKLFLPSFTTKSSGMGIGLAMVQNIIQNANGKISFKSELGKGTTFTLEFPIYKPEEN